MSIKVCDRRLFRLVLLFLVVAVGLPTSLCAQSEATSESARQVNFNSDVAVIFHDKCAMCHRRGQAGPFPLVTYNDVKQRAETIQAVIDSGYMPPWKPINENLEFINDRRLSREQKSVIQNWIASGMPEGDRPAPEPPEFSDGWLLGEPDLVVEMNGRFDVPASGPDVYRSFVFPLELPEDKWVKAIDLKPTATTSVHHAIFFIDRHKNARRTDGQDGQVGIEGMGFLGVLIAPPAPENGSLLSANSIGLRSPFRSISSFSRMLGRDGIMSLLYDRLGVYVPGKVPVPFPDDLAVKLPKGSDIVVQTHFHPSGKTEQEQGKLAIYFADSPPSRKMIPVQVPPMFGVGHGIKIPAGENDYRINDSFELPIDVEAISVFPHGHYVCREASIVAELPGGKEITLVEIDDWDLDWQDTYFFQRPVPLPAGTVLTSQLAYDNSTDNPENPYDPPREIGWGLQSSDEMGSVVLNVVPVRDSERVQLESKLHQYIVSSVWNPDKVVDLVMQLDINGDGSLQRSEAPPGLDSALVFLDGNKNQALEPAELGILKSFLKTFQDFQSKSATSSSRQWVLPCLDGTELDPFADPATRAIALVFISTDCPIANAYQPRLKELERQYRSQGISFFLIHAKSDITPATARAHADRFDLTIPVVIDSDQAIAKRVGARVTPEVFVFQRGHDQPVYRGAIDNLYADYGKKRRQANKHFLKDALDQWLSDQSVKVRRTKPIGCFISYETAQ